MVRQPSAALVDPQTSGRTVSVLGLVESIVRTQVSEMDAVAVRNQFRVLAKVRAWMDAHEADLTARLVELSPGGSAAIAALDIADNARTSKRQTRLLMDRSSALQELPEFSDALRHGSVTAAHVDEVAAALRKAGDCAQELKSHEGALALSAARLPHDQFTRQLNNLVQRLNANAANDEAERQRRSTYLKSWTDANGMIHLRGAFDAERGSVLLGRLEIAMERLFHSGQAAPAHDLSGVNPNDNLCAIALFDLCANGSDPEPERRGSAVRAEISITVDLETLRHGLHENGVCRTSHGAELPVDAVRRLACQADIIPVVLNSDGVPIDVGRRNRLATARQRRLILAMYRTCAVPECDVGVAHCAPHHIDYWENGGRTDLQNLVPLCSRHHHAAHEGGWKLVLSADRTLTVTLPDGRVLSRPLDRNVIRL